MATYKLIQDIEAEDHILGPLTLRQFIFGLIAAFGFYLCFISIAKHVLFLLALFLPPSLFCAFFAFPFGRDQPTEVWALAKLRFLFKPRRRIWDQSGMKELVTITVPKKIEKILTKSYDQTEVQSRLKALANTLDSRGWVIKNANANTYANQATGVPGSDRLIEIDPIPQEVPNYDVQASDDILDETSNPTAHKFENMIAESTQARRKQLIDELNNIRSGEATGANGTPGQAGYWFVSKGSRPATQNQLPPAVSGTAPSVAPASDDASLTRQLQSRARASNIEISRMRTLQSGSPASQATPQANKAPGRPTATAVTPQSDPAILALADRNDLNVSTLAREAYKAKHSNEPSQDEVVVSLH